MNVILLISDTFRYDNLFDRAPEMPVATPNLDAFHERAVSLENLFMASFPTIPHRTDVTTGRYGWPWYGWQDIRRSSRNQMPGILGGHGFVSQLLCDCPHLFGAGFQFAFNAARAIRGQEGDTHFLRMNRPILETMPPEKTRAGKHFQGHNLPDIARWTNYDATREEHCFVSQTSRMTVEWLEENHEWDPFFLWVDFFDPHEPWDPPEYMVKKYDDPDYDGPAMIHPNYGPADSLTPGELKNLRAHYCALAEIVDRGVGRVLQKIDDLRLWDNSIVIFTSDHGTSLGEHNRTGKSNLRPEDERCWPIYPEIARQPFLIAAPGLEGGRSIDTLAQPPDILPTILDLLGLADATETPEPIHGRSFAPQIRGESSDEINDVAITATFLRPRKNPRRDWEDAAGKETQRPAKPERVNTPVVYTKRFAYAPIGAEGEPELYDLANDPYALTNIAAANPEKVRELHARMIAWMQQMEAPAEAFEALGLEA